MKEADPIALFRLSVLGRAQRRGASHAVRDRVKDVMNELMPTGTVHDPARSHMLKHAKPWSALGSRRPINLTLRAKPYSPVKSDPSCDICRRY